VNSNASLQIDLPTQSAPINRFGVRFLDANAATFCVARIDLGAEKQLQAGNRGVGLGGSFVAMGILSVLFVLAPV